jgi:hypothetical protein
VPGLRVASTSLLRQLRDEDAMLRRTGAGLSNRPRRIRSAEQKFHEMTRSNAVISRFFTLFLPTVTIARRAITIP